MSADHDHGHGGATADRRRLVIVLALTAGVLLVQVVGALLSGSLALAADAAHAGTDAAGLVIALVAATLAARPATARRTWGYRRAEVLGATVQAAVLLGVGGWIAVEAVGRLVEPAEVVPTSVLIFGTAGLAANVVGILVLTRGGARDGNVNMRAALLEVVNDALGSVAVLGSAAVIALTGWQQADAVASLMIVGLIVPRTLRLLRETVSVLLESTPPGLDLDAVRAPCSRRKASSASTICTPHRSPADCRYCPRTSSWTRRASTTTAYRRSSIGCRPARPSTSRSASRTPPSNSSRPATPTTSSPRTADEETPMTGDPRPRCHPHPRTR